MRKTAGRRGARLRLPAVYARAHEALVTSLRALWSCTACSTPASNCLTQATNRSLAFKVPACRPANRFGIRGSEPLGNGYSAIFTLEGRFSLDTGSVTYNESLYWCQLTSAPPLPCRYARAWPS